MHNKLFFFDLETTGLDYNQHAIHQISGKIIIDGQEKESFNIRVKPFDGAIIDPQALAACHVTEEMIVQEGIDQVQAHDQLVAILRKYVSPYDKKDKFFMAGYNIAGFDKDFFRKFFERCGDKYFGSWFWPVTVDVMVLAQALMMDIRTTMENFKQGTVAKTLGITVDEAELHDALYDIHICFEIYKKLMERMQPFTPEPTLF